MSETIRGRILSKSISEGKTSDGDPWVRASFEIDGRKYSTFDQEVIDTFDTGSYVELSFDKSKDGKYSNIKEIKKVIEPKESMKTADQMPVQNLEMARMNGLNNATKIIEIASNVNDERVMNALKEVSMIDLVKDIANQLVKYIKEG